MSFWKSAGGGAAIAAVGSGGSGLLGSLFAARNQRRQYYYNLSLQKQQQQWQKEMWNLENLYNLPKNEVQRLLDAGINPALAFGNAGGAAAPIPHSGSAGGVSAPTPPFPNMGSDVVAAMQNQQRIENETKVAESTVDKQEAEADATRAQAGLTETRNRLETVYADNAEVNKPILAKFPALDLQMRQYEVQLGYNKTIRDDFYTANYNDILTLGMEHTRLQNRNLERDYDRIGSQIALLNAQGKLTEEQAKNLQIQRDILLTERYFAQWNYRMARLLNKSVYGSADSPVESNETVRKVIDAARTEAANALASSTLREVSLSKDIGFEKQYGEESRFINRYELPRRQANKVRVDQYTGAVNTLLHIGEAALTRGASGALRGPLKEGLQSTFNDFRGSIQPDERWNNF